MVNLSAFYERIIKEMSSINKTILEFGFRIAREIEAKALLMYADAAQDSDVCDADGTDFEVVLVTKKRSNSGEILRRCRVLTVAERQFDPDGANQDRHYERIAAGLFQKGDKIVCLSGIPKFG
jgi:hypothetical protein